MNSLEGSDDEVKYRRGVNGRMIRVSSGSMPPLLLRKRGAAVRYSRQMCNFQIGRTCEVVQWTCYNKAGLCYFLAPYYCSCLEPSRLFISNLTLAQGLLSFA